LSKGESIESSSLLKSLPYLQAHCQSHTSQLSNQSFVKELAKPT